MSTSPSLSYSALLGRCEPTKKKRSGHNSHVTIVARHTSSHAPETFAAADCLSAYLNPEQLKCVSACDVRHANKRCADKAEPRRQRYANGGEERKRCNVLAQIIASKILEQRHSCATITHRQTPTHSHTHVCRIRFVSKSPPSKCLRLCVRPTHVSCVCVVATLLVYDLMGRL